MVKCEGCGDLVKRSKAKPVVIDGQQRFFCCRGCEKLFWQRYEILYRRKDQASIIQ